RHRLTVMWTCLCALAPWRDETYLSKGVPMGLVGVQSSGVLFIFWLLSVLCAIVPFRSKILKASGQDIQLEVLLTEVSAFYPHLTGLTCFSAHLLISPQNPCPETTAGFLSTVTFWWFT
ncbi:hypothetical protein GOODEAATRI_021352, partial [Goodea atripinnis]